MSERARLRDLPAYWAACAICEACAIWAVIEGMLNILILYKRMN